MLYIILDTLENLPPFFDNYVYNKTKFLLSVQQRFTDGEPEYEMLNQIQYWSFSIPHESSGPCYTYDPPFDSDPGFLNGLYIAFNFENWDPDLDIFLHEKGKFFYQDNWTSDTIRIDQAKLKTVTTGHPRIKGNTNKFKFIQYNGKSPFPVW